MSWLSKLCVKLSKRIYKIVIYTFLFLLVFIYFVPSAFSKSETTRKKVIIFLIDNVNIEELLDVETPNIDSLVERGGIGLINVGRKGLQDPGNTYLSIAAGMQAKGGLYASQAFDINEKVNDVKAKYIYQSRTDILSPDEGIVHLAIGDILRVNEEEESFNRIGALGDELERANLKTAVIGNSDLINESHREATLIAMNREGIVPHGYIAKDLNKKDPTDPEGLSTDYNKMYEAWSGIKSKADFIVIENGDLARLRKNYPILTKEAYKQKKTASLEKADEFLGKIIVDLNLNKDMIIVISPGAERVDVKDGYNLAPIILSSPQNLNKKSGLVTSDSTRRNGIVVNSDLIVTVLNFFKIESKKYNGRKLDVRPSKDINNKLITMTEQIKTTNILRQPLLTTYITLIIIFIISSVGLLFFKWVDTLKIRSVITVVVFFILSVPAALIIQPLIVSIGEIEVILTIVILTFLITYLMVLIDRKSKMALTILCGLTSILIIVDIFAGSPQMKKSILGFSPLIGARFYGLGNEYMGILLGATIVGLTSLLENYQVKISKKKLWISGLFFAFVIFVIGYTRLGANVGGTVAALIGFSIVMAWLSGIKINWKVIITILILTVLAIIILGMIDAYYNSGQSSHLGRVFYQTQNQDSSQIYYLFQRKIEVNIKLFRYTIWSRVLLVAILAFPFILMRPEGVMKRLRKEHPFLMHGILGTTIAALIAFLVNDSGVIAAATTIIFAILGLLYIIFRETELYY